MNSGYIPVVGAPMTFPASSTPHHRRLSSMALELMVVGSIFILYRAGRTISKGAADQALQNATHVISIEQALGLFSEQSMQQWALQSQTFIEFLNRYYVGVHFPITIAFLVWAYLRHHDAYRLARTWFVGVTMAALAIHVMFPLAPPRMTQGFVDTLHVFGPQIYAVDPHHSVANQFAAMPSLHFGWALMLAMSVILIKRSITSMLVLAHPLFTLTAIIATGNHYWLDAIAVTVLAGIVGVMVLMARSRAAEMLQPLAVSAVANDVSGRPSGGAFRSRPDGVLATLRPQPAARPERPAPAAVALRSPASTLAPAGGRAPEWRAAPSARRSRGCTRSNVRHPAGGCSQDRSSQG